MVNQVLIGIDIPRFFLRFAAPQDKDGMLSLLIDHIDNFVGELLPSAF